MCIHQQDHCIHRRIQISLTLPQQGLTHMDSENLSTRDPSTGTWSLAALKLLKRRKHSKTSKDSTVQQAGCIKIKVHCFIISFILVYIFFLTAHCYFHVTVLHFGCFVNIIYISVINTYYVLCMCCFFVLLSNLSTM